MFERLTIPVLLTATRAAQRNTQNFWAHGFLGFSGDKT
jgi:hypothetical protein